MRTSAMRMSPRRGQHAPTGFSTLTSLQVGGYVSSGSRTGRATGAQVVEGGHAGVAIGMCQRGVSNCRVRRAHAVARVQAWPCQAWDFAPARRGTAPHPAAPLALPGVGLRTRGRGIFWVGGLSAGKNGSQHNSTGLGPGVDACGQTSPSRSGGLRLCQGAHPQHRLGCKPPPAIGKHPSSYSSEPRVRSSLAHMLVCCVPHCSSALLPIAAPQPLASRFPVCLAPTAASLQAQAEQVPPSWRPRCCWLGRMWWLTSEQAGSAGWGGCGGIRSNMGQAGREVVLGKPAMVYKTEGWEAGRQGMVVAGEEAAALHLSSQG